jgi:hypothetical protein
VAGNGSVDHDQFFAAMIVKNGFEAEYVTMLDESTYLTLEVWLAASGTEVEYNWMNLDGDDSVSWTEFLNAKI